MANLAAMGRHTNKQQPTHVRRMYLVDGYQHNLLNGPYTLPLSPKDIDKIKWSYLHREFIVSSMTITIQTFKYRHRRKLLTLPFTSDLIESSEELDASHSLRLNVGYEIEIYQLFQQARIAKAEINIPFHLSPTNSVLYRIFKSLFGLIIVFNCLINCLHNMQIISSSFISVNVAYAFAFLIYFAVKQPFYDVVYSFFICCFCMLFGSVICIIWWVAKIMTQQVNVIIRNTMCIRWTHHYVHQMESDIAYFISQRDCIENDDQESHNNWNLLMNASSHILSAIMHDFIMEHITNNCTKDANYKHCQMTKFATEYQLNSECLFEYRKCDEMVKEKNNSNNNILQNIPKYFKYRIKMCLLVSSTYLVLNYVVLIALGLDDSQFIEKLTFTFNYVLYCRIISDLVILIFIIPYIMYRKYHISMQFILCGNVHWLDQISLQYFCNNALDKNYGIQFVFNMVCDYCYVSDVYMNNYITYQTFLALQQTEEFELLCDDILHILMSYLWFQPNSKIIDLLRKCNYDGLNLKSMMINQNNIFLERLNQLTLIKHRMSPQFLIERNYKNQTKT